MAEKTIELSFDGYCPNNEDNLLNTSKHDCSGIYAVCVAKPTKIGYSIERPIYIGESKNVGERLTKDHEHYEDWKNELNSGEKLYFSIADVDDGYRERVEAALICKMQPKINQSSKESFNYDKTTIKSSGSAKGAIPNEFTVSSSQ
jgi:hypothetical protein